MTTRARAVTTSLRPRRPSTPIPTAARTANTPRPTSVLMPIRLAPAAPANAPLGMAWAGKAEPRRTTKKPDHARDHGNDRRHHPGVDHEAGEHVPVPFPTRHLLIAVRVAGAPRVQATSRVDGDA